jgi:hypothetical protein
MPQYSYPGRTHVRLLYSSTTFCVAGRVRRHRQALSGLEAAARDAQSTAERRRGDEAFSVAIQADLTPGFVTPVSSAYRTGFMNW